MLTLQGAATHINVTGGVSPVRRYQGSLPGAVGNYGVNSYAVFYDTLADEAGSNGVTQILARWVDQTTGLPSGSEVTIPLPTLASGQNRFHPEPTELGDGSFVVLDITGQMSGQVYTYGWRLEYFSPAGVFQRDLASGLGYSDQPGSLIGRPDGKYDLIAQQSNSSGGLQTTTLVETTYTAAGAPVATQTLASLTTPVGDSALLAGAEFWSGSSVVTEIRGYRFDSATSSSIYTVTLNLPGAASPIVYSATSTVSQVHSVSATGGGFAGDGSFTYGILADATLNIYRVAAGSPSPTPAFSIAQSDAFAQPTIDVLSNGDVGVALDVWDAASSSYLHNEALYSPTGRLLGRVANGSIRVTTTGQIDEEYFTPGGDVYTQPLNYIPSAVASDLNGDSMSDVLFRNAAGVTYLWTMNGAMVASGATTSVQVGANWQIKGVADFNSDGKKDLLWVYDNASNASDPLNGVSYVSFQNGAGATGGGVVQQLSSAWRVAGTGDFNGDGMADVLYRNTSTGQTYLDIMNGSSVNWAASGFTSQQVNNANWQVAAVADFNGDGDTDVLWRYNNASNASDALNGTLYEWRMNGTSVTSAGLLSQQAGGAWQVAGTGDFNGDGNADILFRYQNGANASDVLNGFTYIDFMNGTAVTSGAPTQWQIDNSWAVASIGDYNGDGMSDLLLQQTSTGNTYIWQMSGATVTSGAFTSAQAGTGWTVQNGVLIA